MQPGAKDLFCHKFQDCVSEDYLALFLRQNEKKKPNNKKKPVSNTIFKSTFVLANYCFRCQLKKEAAHTDRNN